MIDVQINPMGRTLLTMVLGVLKYQAVVQSKTIKNLQEQIKNIQEFKQSRDMWDDLSFDMTTRMLDKRFTSSKLFIESRGGEGSKTFKKSTSKNDKLLQYITEKNKLKSRTKFNTAVSAYNQSIADKNVRTSFKQIIVNQIF